MSLAATTRDVANPMAMVREVIQSAVPPTASAQFRSSIHDFVDMLNSHMIEFCSQLTGGDIDRSDIEQWCSTHEPKVMVHHIPFIEAALGFTLPRRNKVPPSAQLVCKENSSCLSAVTVRRNDRSNGMSRRRRTPPMPARTPRTAIACVDPRVLLRGRRQGPNAREHAGQPRDVARAARPAQRGGALCRHPVPKPPGLARPRDEGKV